MAEATETLLEIHSVIERTDATAEALQEFAERLLRSVYHYFKSVQLLSVAASLYMARPKQRNASTKSKQSTMADVGSCVKSIQLATDKMMTFDVRNKTFVRNHVIPLMCDILTSMEKFETDDETSKMVEIVSALHSIVKSEKKIHEFCAASNKFEDAVGRLDEAFSNRKTIEDSGNVFAEIRRLHEATAQYRTAIMSHDNCGERIVLTYISYCMPGQQGRNEGSKGCTTPRVNHYGGAKPLRGAPNYCGDSPNNVTGIFFTAEHLLPKDFRFENGVPNMLLAPGAI